MNEGAVIAAVAAVIGSFIMAFSSLAVAVVNRNGSARKTDVEALTGTIKTLQDENKRLHECQDELNERIDELEIRLENEKIINSQLRAWAEALVNQIYKLGGVPVPMPEPPSKPRQK